MDRKTGFQNSANFIFKITSKRIRDKQKSFNKTQYEVLGFDSEFDYQDRKHTIDYVNYDIKVINNILNFNEHKKTPYSFPSNYFLHIQKILRFRDVHEMLWGTNQEIKKYCSKLFSFLFEDMLDDKKMRPNCESLLDLISTNLYDEAKKAGKIRIFSNEQKINQIYSGIEQEFLKEFLLFTRAGERHQKLFEISHERGVQKVFDDIAPKIYDDTKIDEYRGFKKLPELLKDFSSERVFPILTSLIIKKMI